MSYSTVTDATRYLPTATEGLETSDIAEIISDADRIIRNELGQIIDFTQVTNFIPDAIVQLSQYKTRELVLVTQYSTKRLLNETNDIQYWNDKYTDFREEIRKGKVPVTLADGTSIMKGQFRFATQSNKDVIPFLGDGPRGEFINKEDQKNLGQNNTVGIGIGGEFPRF